MRAIKSGTLKVAYMNLRRGCVVMHVFLEVCARRKVGVYFVGECLVARTGSGTH